ncbi:helix-turn-helix transcriptional regulator [Raineyella fluvialis]|uniref:WYL domain-containing protein n=1 Tax=Raineyella fluvialis TaxID=2662261 RepID=A0A5Q2FDK2_9ACTN|nr:WYL domain-containing protein [Raineyella fluvialis]QGF24848.1 WYL domain-containing protein [Raineyella fluvialis]
MAPSSAERRVGLTLLLLGAPQPLTKARIRSLVEGYADLSDAAFNQAFERDKRALRVELGLPIETSGAGEDEGYRIRLGDFALEPVDLAPEEAGAVALAARSWREAGMAASSQRALMKLRSIGVEPDTDALASLFTPSDVAETRPEATHGLAVLRDAVTNRRRVTFEYADRGVRHVEPWGLAMAHGQWYLFGADLDRAATRRFKLARIQGRVRSSTANFTFPEPDPEEVRRLSEQISSEHPADEAVLALRLGREGALHRPLTPADRQAPEGYRAWRVAYTYRKGFVGELAMLGTDVVVLTPPELASALVDHLTAMLRAGQAAGVADGGEVTHGVDRH